MRSPSPPRRAPAPTWPGIARHQRLPRDFGNTPGRNQCVGRATRRERIVHECRPPVRAAVRISRDGEGRPAALRSRSAAMRRSNSSAAAAGPGRSSPRWRAACAATSRAGGPRARTRGSRRCSARGSPSRIESFHAKTVRSYAARRSRSRAVPLRLVSVAAGPFTTAGSSRSRGSHRAGARGAVRLGSDPGIARDRKQRLTAIQKRL